MTRNLSDNDIREMDTTVDAKKDKRKGDRRKAINSYIDPAMERRKGDRRK
jgi:hypothetical protein